MPPSPTTITSTWLTRGRMPSDAPSADSLFCQRLRRPHLRNRLVLSRPARCRVVVDFDRRPALCLHGRHGDRQLAAREVDPIARPSLPHRRRARSRHWRVRHRDSTRTPLHPERISHDGGARRECSRAASRRLFPRAHAADDVDGRDAAGDRPMEIARARCRIDRPALHGQPRWRRNRHGPRRLLPSASLRHGCSNRGGCCAQCDRRVGVVANVCSCSTRSTGRIRLRS